MFEVESIEFGPIVAVRVRSSEHGRKERSERRRKLKLWSFFLLPPCQRNKSCIFKLLNSLFSSSSHVSLESLLVNSGPLIRKELSRREGDKRDGWGTGAESLIYFTPHSLPIKRP